MCPGGRDGGELHDPRVCDRRLPGGTLRYRGRVGILLHDLFDLLPQTVLVATTCRKDDVSVDELGLGFRFVTLTPHKSFGFQTVTVEEHPVQIIRPSKTLANGLDRSDLCGGIVEATKEIYCCAREYGEWEQVAADTQHLGNRTVFKRLGYLAELSEVEVGKWLERCRAEIQGQVKEAHAFHDGLTIDRFGFVGLLQHPNSIKVDISFREGVQVPIGERPTRWRISRLWR